MFSNITRFFNRQGFQLVSQSLQPSVLSLKPRLFQSSLSKHYTIPSNRSERWKSNSHWIQNMLNIRKFLLYTSAVLLTGDCIYYMWMISSNNRRVNKTIEKGTQPQDKVSEDKFIPRYEIMVQLRKIFQPDKDQSSYYVIYGEHGTGKTTLIKRVAREIGKGVIYIDIPEDFNKLGEEFGKAINFKFEEDVKNSMLISRLKQKFFGNNNKDIGKIINSISLFIF